MGLNGQPVPDGNYNITFKLYDESSNVIWTEVHNQVAISGGLFQVLLGTVTPFSIPFNKPYSLGIQVGSDAELQPRMTLTSAAYAIRAEEADKLLGISVNATPQPNTLLPLDNSGKFPASVIPGGSATGDYLKKNVPDTSIGTSTNPMLLGSNLGDGAGIEGQSTNGVGIVGRGTANDGVTGWTGASGKSGVYGSSTNGRGVTGRSDNDNGIVGWTGNDYTSAGKSGVYGHTDNEYGVGVRGESPYIGVRGEATTYGVFGEGHNVGLFGKSGADINNHIVGTIGVYGESSGPGVIGVSHDFNGVVGWSINGYGVYGESSSSYAGYFDGNVNITGTLSKASGSFKIDHPLDPANKYLYHSFVESPDMMNIYNGNVVLDSRGEAWVELPAYFETLNQDFRYQLTCIGGFAQVYVAEKVQNNRFKITGGTSGLEVSWQVTGIRHDPFAEAHRIQVEVEKTGNERGKYIHPKEYGVQENLGIDFESNNRMMMKTTERLRKLEPLHDKGGVNK